MTDIHPAEPGAYWGKSEEDGPYDVIVFITGKVPFLEIARVVLFRDGDKVSGSVYIGPKIEPLCVDEPAMVEGGAE